MAFLRIFLLSFNLYGAGTMTSIPYSQVCAIVFTRNAAILLVFILFTFFNLEVTLDDADILHSAR